MSKFSNGVDQILGTLEMQFLTYLTAKQQPPVSPLTKEELKDADTSALERQIDQRVYKLYNLTPEEIAIVEGK